MSEVTLEVPAAYAVGIQETLVDLRDDAQRTVKKCELGIGEDPPKYVEQARLDLERLRPLIEQGRLADAESVVKYRGETSPLRRAIGLHLGELTESLNNIALAGPGLGGSRGALEMIGEITWLFESSRQIGETELEAVTA